MSDNYTLQLPNLKKTDNELDFTADPIVDRKIIFAEYNSALRADLKKNHDNSALVLVVRAGVFAYLPVEPDIMFFNNVKTPESTANTISQFVPPECIKNIVIIVDYDNNVLRRRSVQTLQDADYHNIETIDELCFNLSLNRLAFDCGVGKLVFINFLSEFDSGFVNYPLHVVRKCKDGWQLVDTFPTPTIALSKYPSTRHVVISKGAPEAIHREVKALFPKQLLHLLETCLSVEYELQFVFARAYHGVLESSSVFPFCYVDIFVQFGGKSETISLNKRVTPFTFTKEIDVGNASNVTVRAFSHGKFASSTAVKTLTFNKPAYRRVSITVNVDKNYAPEMILRTASTYKRVGFDFLHLKLDPSPKTVLTFTADNRVLIEADETYTGDKEIMAYVRLQRGKAAKVGQRAFNALKTHPGSVFYGITQLFATDFDPDHPDPSWGFKTSRDADGKVVVRGGDKITTLPIVLFGLVVNSTLLYIKDHNQSEVSELGIRLPAGSVITEDELESVSDRIGVDLKLLLSKRSPTILSFRRLPLIGIVCLLLFCRVALGYLIP